MATTPHNAKKTQTASLHIPETLRLEIFMLETVMEPPSYI
jgi:hypothetical protein